MPCTPLKNDFICSPNIYQYKGWIFEVPYYGGPWPLTAELMPRKRAGKVFWAMWYEFNELSDKTLYIYGG